MSPFFLTRRPSTRRNGSSERFFFFSLAARGLALRSPSFMGIYLYGASNGQDSVVHIPLNIPSLRSPKNDGHDAAAAFPNFK
jgi:hypothetical protein